MIISKIIGGLGNQMFQYATGRAVSSRLSTPLHLDVSGFTGYKLHQGFELTRVFACDPELATAAEVRNLLGWRASAFAQRILPHIDARWIRRGNLVIEPHHHYWPEINTIRDNVYLSGYWQSERYFRDISETIRADFTFRQPLSEFNAELADEILHRNAVSVHVRRGDYVTDPKTNAVLGVCSLDYYRAAISHMSEHLESPEFFVFSDDISWVKENLQFGFPYTFVDHNRGQESYNDMRLMSLCSHHIIANSSFSWWGAWLNPRVEKIVIAPKKWFSDTNRARRDLIPSDWLEI